MCQIYMAGVDALWRVFSWGFGTFIGDKSMLWYEIYALLFTGLDGLPAFTLENGLFPRQDVDAVAVLAHRIPIENWSAAWQKLDAPAIPDFARCHYLSSWGEFRDCLFQVALEFDVLRL